MLTSLTLHFLHVCLEWPKQSDHKHYTTQHFLTLCPHILQDLQYLSEGLEGRSKNPVALLFDTLFHPNADVGEEGPSVLKWANPEKTDTKCSHVVMGRERPGGQWHTMDKSILTLSLRNWLELPMFGFDDWKKSKGRSGIDEDMPDFFPSRFYANLRATAGDVAEYYESYVEKLGLSESFKAGLTVEKIEMKRKCSRKKSNLSDSKDRAEAAPTKRNSTCPLKSMQDSVGEDRGIMCPMIEECYCWTIRSKRLHPGENVDSMAEDHDVIDESRDFVVKAKNLVLASGLGTPLSLGVPGEDLSYICTLNRLQKEKLALKQSQKRVLVVGAGMSGSDVALFCLKEGIHCYHVFKQKPDDPNLIVAGMAAGIYQEYHHLSNLMKGVKTTPLYTPLSQHVVKEFKANGECVLTNLKSNQTVTVQVERAVIMIGYGADLDFLPEEVKIHLIQDPTKPVHSKHNTLDVDLYSFRSEAFPNLYALGPLTGDNFVRFVFGSGLGCAQSILKKKACKCPKAT